MCLSSNSPPPTTHTHSLSPFPPLSFTPPPHQTHTLSPFPPLPFPPPPLSLFPPPQCTMTLYYTNNSNLRQSTADSRPKRTLTRRWFIVGCLSLILKQTGIRRVPGRTRETAEQALVTSTCPSSLLLSVPGWTR